ncbi:unnamed protein product, partial [Urochloa humidicola]
EARLGKACESHEFAAVHSEECFLPSLSLSKAGQQLLHSESADPWRRVDTTDEDEGNARLSNGPDHEQG